MTYLQRLANLEARGHKDPEQANILSAELLDRFQQHMDCPALIQDNAKAILDADDGNYQAMVAMFSNLVSFIGATD